MSYTYTWSDAEQTTLKREDAEGNVAYVPAAEGNRDYAEFVSSGATADPYVAPPEPAPLSTEEKVDQLLVDYDLTRDDLSTALGIKVDAKTSKK